MPSAVFATTAFMGLARAIGRAQGAERMRAVELPHPFSGLTAEEARTVAERVVQAAAEALQGAPALDVGGDGQAYSETVDVTGPSLAEAVNEAFAVRRWSEGLPVIPPTREAVDRFLGRVGRDPDEVLGVMPPANGRATVRGVAINALMAGCDPSYVPVVLAAVEAMLDPAFDLLGVQATTNPATPMLVVNGPIARDLGINSGYGLLGPGPRPNAAIGRAIRLVLQNIGGALPGQTDRSTFGTPAKYTFCFAENEAESPWPPLHVERGFDRDASVVTVFAAAGPHNVIDPGSVTGPELLGAIGLASAAIGNNNLYWGGEMAIIVSPEHAQAMARDGCATRREVQEALFAAARVPLGHFSAGTLETIAKWRPAWWAASHGRPEAITPVDAPGDYTVICAGGAGRHSVVVPIFARIRSISRLVGSCGTAGGGDERRPT